MHPFLNIDLIVHFINTTLRGTHALTDFMVEIPSNWEVLLLDALLRRLDPGNASFYDQDKILAELKEQGFYCSFFQEKKQWIWIRVITYRPCRWYLFPFVCTH